MLAPSERQSGTPPGPRPHSGTRAFGILWTGQLVSLLGSSAAAFCLALTVYTETGNASALALVVGASSLSMIYPAPLAGAVSDHFPRRRVVCVSNTALSAVSLLLAWQVWEFSADDSSGFWGVLVLVFLAGTLKAALSTAMAASVRELRSESDLSRVNGFTSLVETIPTVSGPVVGAALYSTVSPAAVFALEAVTFAAAAVMAATIRWPSTQPARAAGRRLRPFAGARRGFRFILKHGGFRTLQLCYAGVNVFAGVATAVVTVYVVSASPAGSEEWNLAVFHVAGPVGLLLGALVVLGVGGRGSRLVVIVATLAGGALLGRLGLALVAVPVLWFVAQIVNQACAQISNAQATAVWQERTPPEMQATVFGARRLLGQGPFPLAIVVGGVLADRFFQDGGALASAAGSVIPRLGEDGGGAGLLLAVCALGQAVLAVALGCSRQVRAVTRRPTAPAERATGAAPATAVT